MGRTYKSTRKPNSFENKDLQVNAVNEPQSAYYLNLNNPSFFIAELLGLSPSIQTEMQYIQASRNGIKKIALGKLASKMGITSEKMCQLLHISLRTYQRLKDNDSLDIFTSEQAIEMAQVLAKAQGIFQNEANVKQWLQAPLLALGGSPPVNLLDTGFGAKLVLDTLGRLEHGIYS